MQFNLLKIILFVFFLSNHIFATEIQTHLEKSNFTELTPYVQMMHFVRELEKSSLIIQMKIIGSSVEDREIPALFFTLEEEFASNRKEKPVVLIICQQHGNEPSGKEAALIVARKLVNEYKYILDKLDLILVPQVNPDGSERGQRNNANDMDLNRNHVILSEPESFTVHNLFLDWMPEVTLDVHEFNAIKKEWIEAGFIKDADEMLSGVTNVNIDPEIIKFTRGTFIPETGSRIKADGYRFHRYIVGMPFENKRIRHSTTSITDARQSMGIYNTLSFIIEGKRYGNLINEIERRTKGQVSAILSFLETTATHSRSILNIVSDARQHSLEHSAQYKFDVHVRMDYFPDSTQKTLSFPVFDLYKWEHTTRDLQNYEPIVKVTKSVSKPFAYIFSAHEKKLIELLRKHRIPLFTIKNDTEIEVESYHIVHITSGVDEDKPAISIDLRKEKSIKTYQPGDVVVKLNNAAANFIPLLLELESNWGIVTKRGGEKYRFKDYLKENSLYPISRIPDAQELLLEVY